MGFGHKHLSMRLERCCFMGYHPDVQPVDEPGSASDPVTKDGQDALEPADSGVVEPNQELADVEGREPDQEELPCRI